MVDRRPHTLKFKLATGSLEPTRDENGDWIIPENTPIEKQLKCRVEPNGTGRLIAGADGKSVVYSWTIYLDRNAQKLSYGHKVEVFKGNELIAKGDVLMFNRGQMNARIWI